MDLAQALEQVKTLRRALESRGRVGIAIGICMERFRLQEDAAFQLLVRISQHENRKLVVIAEEVIDGRDLTSGVEMPEGDDS